MLRGFDEERFAALLGGFTEETRGAVTLAREEAARLGHGQAGSGHLLLGLLRDGEGVAARALASLGATPKRRASRSRTLVAAARKGRWTVGLSPHAW